MILILIVVRRQAGYLDRDAYFHLGKKSRGFQGIRNVIMNGRSRKLVLLLILNGIIRELMLLIPVVGF